MKIILWDILLWQPIPMKNMETKLELLLSYFIRFEIHLLNHPGRIQNPIGKLEVQFYYLQWGTSLGLLQIK